MSHPKVNLANELNEAGYGRHPDDYRVIVLEVFQARHSDWTDEELLYHPSLALEYCKAVNFESGVELPDRVILRTLVNCRKRSFGIDPTT